MAMLKYQNVGIAGITAAVPVNVITNYSYTDHFPADEVKKVVDKIGIYERRFVDEKTCASDLCFAAAENLLKSLNIQKSDIDALLFVSQTPDYRMPATSVILQNRLGLNRSTLAFDINLGCSAFLFALQTAYSFLQNPGINKVLILNGETRSKVYSPKDRKTAFLFGDAGAAILVEKGKKYGDSFFSLNSDGSQSSTIKINAGGYRNPSTAEGLQEKVVDEYGNIRHDEHGYMDGENVFGFVAKEVPNDIKTLLEYSNLKKDEVDYFILHQASKIINDYLIKKLKIGRSNVPVSYHKYGNTSSVSLPLTTVFGLKGKVSGQKKICYSAFGVGLSWGSAIINLNDCLLGEILEV